MDILIVSRGIPTKKYPQMGIFEYDQAKALAAMGYKVYFFAVDLRSFRRKRSYGIHSGMSDGVFWHRIDIPIGAVPMCVSCAIGRWALEILYKKVFGRDKRPDVIHAHFTEQGYIAAYLAEREQIPLVITEHSSRMNQENISLSLKKHAYKAYSATVKVIAVSTCLADNIEKKIGIRCEIIPNIVDKGMFMRKSAAGHKGFGFIMTGNLIPRKRPLLLLEAFGELYRKYPDIYLGFIGNGTLKNEMVRKAANMGITDSVKFYGMQPRRKMPKVYGQYDCFVLPSSNETFGVVYIEAMAAGLPVIAARCGGPEDFVTDETGYLISVDNKKELIQAMEKMYHEQKKFNKNQISRYVREHFSGEAVSACLTDIYLEMMRHGS